MPWVLGPEEGMVCRSPSLPLPTRSPIHNTCMISLARLVRLKVPLTSRDKIWGQTVQVGCFYILSTADTCQDDQSPFLLAELSPHHIFCCWQMG